LTREAGGWLSAFDASFLEQSGRVLFPNASHGADIYIWDFTRASRKPGSRGRQGKERERERTRAGLPGVLTLYVAFCSSLIILSLPSYSLVSRDIPGSTAARTFRGRSSHYACPIHSRTARRSLRRSRERILVPGDPSVCRYVRISPS